HLDSDTRDYLRLLLNGGANAFRDPGSRSQDGTPSPAAVADASAALRQFDPFVRDARAVTEELGQRRENLRSAGHGLEEVMTSLGAVNGDIATLVNGANRTFAATGSQNRQLAAALTRLPGALQAVNTALKGTEGFGRQLGIATSKLHGFARGLAPAQQALQPVATQTLPVLSNQLRPFARDTQPIVAKLQPAITQFSQSMPGLKQTTSMLQGFFNGLSYNPPGSEEGYLFWGAWLSHII